MADNGPGIDAKYHAKIFRIFQTLVPHDQQENTGIGLAIVKKIVELYSIKSQQGQGTTVTVVLPEQA